MLSLSLRRNASIDADCAMSRRGFTIVETVIVMAIITLLLALAIPAIQRVRATADAIRCGSNLRQIGYGLHHHQADYGYLPPGVASGKLPSSPFPRMSFLTRILPYIEKDVLWREACGAFAESPIPFDNPPHSPFAKVVMIFSCPMDHRLRRAQATHNNRVAALTSYVGVIGTDVRRQDGLLYLDSQHHTASIDDGASYTLLVGERPPSPDFWYGWWYASVGQLGRGSPDVLLGTRELNLGGKHTVGCPPGPYHFVPGRFGVQADVFHFWSPHPGGSHFLFADGAVRFLRYSADAILPALGTRGGGEPVGLD
jgi:prepilin-type N-terminal cleavage/methylation domain-containing protein/prepilin-type processing-associated H-X9-DG protein